MDVWKIQLVLMAFCALMQTYQAALSSKVREERHLSSAWQVSCINVEVGLMRKFASIGDSY